MQWATADLDRDNLQLKVNYQGEKLTEVNNDITQLQQLLVKNKQDLGEALNQAYEFEKINTMLMGKIENMGMKLEDLEKEEEKKEDQVQTV